MNTAESRIGEWATEGLVDDVRPQMFRAAEAGETLALATIVAADGGPRPVGAQMLVTRAAWWGFLSGGCIEADVALHARETISDGQPRRLVYGEGSPFIDIRLPCGGRIEVEIERVPPDDAAVHELRRLTQAREPALWISDGTHRSCRKSTSPDPTLRARVQRRYDPAQRLVVAGTDPFALAIAALGQRIGWDTVLLAPFALEGDEPFDVPVLRSGLADSLASIAPDQWTAIAVATHDLERDREALVPALAGAAGYVGVLGSRRKLDERKAGLRAAGLCEAQIERLRAPIGLPIGAASPWEVALSVIAEIVADSRARATGEAA
jgi:xanthine dehydrogenase accessory factor|tara:strand:+ start:1509 stop:2477 length:969 start_codon:yes stop_codon:yes gene_type:complete